MVGKTDFDLIVIGTGSGGASAAHRSAEIGKKVAVVEDDTIGGECPNYGCVPTKALLQAAEVYQTTKNAGRFGTHPLRVHFDYHQIKAWKERAVLHTGTCEGKHLLRHEGITVISGHAKFVNDKTITVYSHHYSSKKFLIATGSKPLIPPIPGLDEIEYMTYREAISLNQPPASLFIIGGGPIGVEFGHLFNVFDTHVHIADIAPHLLPLEDVEVGQLLAEEFTKRGMKVNVASKVFQVSRNGGMKTVYFEGADGKTHEATVESILVASGKAANVDLGLENAGVEFDRHGIKVNNRMQTTNKHIYAAGDVVGPYGFTHTATYQSRIAANNMWHRRHQWTADYHAVPRCVFVDPEIATVGLTEIQVKSKGINYQVAISPINIIGRANTAGVEAGFVKIIADKERGKLLGASIVSPRAGEMIHELTLAIQHHMTAADVAKTIHAFPTWSESIKYAARKIKV